MLLTELIQEFARRIHIGGDVVLRLKDDRGRWFAVELDTQTFNAMDPDDETGKMVAVLPIVYTPEYHLSGEQPREGGES